MVVPKRISQAHSTMQEGGGLEVMEFGGILVKVKKIKGDQILWAHPQDGPILQLPGESVIGS